MGGPEVALTLQFRSTKRARKGPVKEIDGPLRSLIPSSMPIRTRLDAKRRAWTFLGFQAGGFFYVPSLLLFLSLTAVASDPGWAAAEPLQALPVRVEAPAELAAVGREVERLAPAAIAAAAELVGGDSAALLAEVTPVSVVLVPEGSAAARAVPPWMAGYALSGRGPGELVLLPARADRYPDFGLDAVLRHELTHLLVDRAAGSGDVPRWFNEGLAMTVGRSPDLGDRARLALAVIDDGSLPLVRLDSAFSGGEAEVHSAYALAGDLVREILARHGRASVPRILAAVAQGAPFRAAFAAVTGERLDDFESSYWSRRTLLDRWVPIVSSSVLLWGGISLLAIAAIRRRRARDAERLARWGAEELAMEPEFVALAESDEEWPPKRPEPKRWRR
jgi:hypothetical protein